MSKHTNKVNGKLNFLIVALVLVVGAVTFLLVKPISFQFNASDLSGSGDKAIKGVNKAKKYDNRNEVVVDLNGEEIQELFNNQDFQKMIGNPEFSKLAEMQEFKEWFGSRSFKAAQSIINGSFGEKILDSSTKDYGEQNLESNIDLGTKTQKLRADGFISISEWISRGEGSGRIKPNPDSDIISKKDFKGDSKVFLSKISEFQKFMKSDDFLKFSQASGIEFKKLVSSGEFEIFMNSNLFKEFTSDNQMLQFIVNSDLEAFSKVPDFKKLVSPTFEKFLNNSLFNKMMKNDDVMRFLNSPTFQKLSVNNSFRKLFTSTEFDKFKNGLTSSF
jgi:F0F1-type ATP synthase delta subunit|tara:strand:+ start:1258 stop:2250 length:993 start_codon:yes stop_codon:yes gene_type:complete